MWLKANSHSSNASGMDRRLDFYDSHTHYAAYHVVDLFMPSSRRDPLLHADWE